jgi:hypothetical protein
MLWRTSRYEYIKALLYVIAGITTHLVTFATIGVLAACASIEGLTARATQQATAQQMQEEIISTPPFHLSSWSRITARGDAITIYIEGDGDAWISRRQPATNPTPRTAVALSLAAEDLSANVAYLGRPCQFAAALEDAACAPDPGVRYWTSARFSPEVIEAMSNAITHLARKAHAKHIHLVGYSGGGAVAVLVAALRNDVVSVRTVAGLIDVGTQVALLRISPLWESSDPAEYAYRLRHIPQIHFVGQDDKVVPPRVAAAYLEKSEHSRCVNVEIILEQDHHKGWDKKWETLLGMQPRCL